MQTYIHTFPPFLGTCKRDLAVTKTKDFTNPFTKLGLKLSKRFPLYIYIYKVLPTSLLHPLP